MAEGLHLRDVPLHMLLLGRFKCPHCFEVFVRPFRMLGWIPGLRWFLNRKKGHRLLDGLSEKRRAGKRNYGYPRRIRWLALIGRGVEKTESRLLQGIAGSFRWFGRLLVTVLSFGLLERRRKRKKRSGRRGNTDETRRERTERSSSDPPDESHSDEHAGTRHRHRVRVRRRTDSE